MSFERIEEKLDKLMEMAVEQKVDMVEVKLELRSTNDKVEDHITQDEKIIARMTPMIEAFEYQSKKKKETLRRAKEFAIMAAYVSVPASILGAIIKIFI